MEINTTKIPNEVYLMAMLDLICDKLEISAEEVENKAKELEEIKLKERKDVK